MTGPDSPGPCAQPGGPLGGQLLGLWKPEPGIQAKGLSSLATHSQTAPHTAPPARARWAPAKASAVWKPGPRLPYTSP